MAALESSAAPAQSAPPPFPVGTLSAYPTVVQTGVKPTLEWSISYPPLVDPEAGYVNFIRQILYPSGVMHDIQVPSSGQQLSELPIDPGGAKFELWTLETDTLSVYLLDTTYVGPYVPMATVAIRSEDPYPLLPRTRADRPFHVDVTVDGMLTGASDPEPSKSVTYLHHAQSYGPTGTGADLDRFQATLISQSSITTNGTQTFTYQMNAVPGENPSKARGEERFSVFSLEDDTAPASQLSSKFIQIWPVADGTITGISEGQVIGPEVPELTLTLNDLYPNSTTWAQVYKGGPKEGVTGTTVPGTAVVINDSVPANRIFELSGYGSVFDSDGVWTMEVLTETPFGTDRITTVSFTMQGLGMTVEGWRQAQFGSTENSGDGANISDFDHDGLPNLIEFAFGLDPKHHSAGELPAPVLEGNDQVIRFTPPSGLLGIHYGVEWSPDLMPENWIAIPDTGVSPEHCFRLPANASPQVFLRIKVVAP